MRYKQFLGSATHSDPCVTDLFSIFMNWDQREREVHCKHHM
jgi:hypothetical protein